MMGGIGIAMISLPTPDCRGGAFAVFAKIPPPVPLSCIAGKWVLINRFKLSKTRELRHLLGFAESLFSV